MINPITEKKPIALRLSLDPAAAKDLGDLTYEFEVIHEGSFEKEGHYQFDVPDDQIVNWSDTTNEQIINGEEILYVDEHNYEGENKLGKIVGSTARRKEDGKMGLFPRVKFENQESAEIALSKSVSLYAPPEYGRWQYPIRHIAATNSPVIKDLKPHSPLVLSYQPSKPKPNSEDIGMKASEFAKIVGLTLSEGHDETDFSPFVKSLKDGKTAQDELTKAQDDLKSLKLSHEEYKKANPPSKTIEIPGAMKKTVINARSLELSNLVGKHITKAQKDKLEKVFCDEDKVSLVLSQDSDDGFDFIVEVLKLSDGVKLESDTPPQELELSEENNPMLKNAIKRAEAFAS